MTRDDQELLRERLASWLGATGYVEIGHGVDPARRVGVLRAERSPRPGRTTYCSFGLSSRDWSHRRFPYRLEVLTACDGDEPALARIVATIAFHMVDRDFLAGPGSVLRGAIGILGAGELSVRLPHVYFARPFPWSMPTPFVKLASAPVVAVYAIPIAEGEARFWKENGNAAFEARLEESGVDVFDLRRGSCV
jgi:hypothetical protein